MSESIVFDRAAENYDATRALTPAAQAEVVDLLVPELEDRGRCLEIGIGTGRIALPLLRAGIDIVGADLSLPMLSRLVQKLGNDDRLPVALADVTRLPFGDQSIGAALACHVLHLIPGWREAARELVRVLRPHGIFLLDLGGGPGGDWRAIFRHASEQLGITRPRVGLTNVAEFDTLLTGLGASVRPLAPVHILRRQPLADALTELETQMHSWTWDIPPDSMRAAVATTREWAASRFGDLDETRDVEAVINWRAYDWG